MREAQEVIGAHSVGFLIEVEVNVTLLEIPMVNRPFPGHVGRVDAYAVPILVAKTPSHVDALFDGFFRTPSQGRTRDGDADRSFAAEVNRTAFIFRVVGTRNAASTKIGRASCRERV